MKEFCRTGVSNLWMSAYQADANPTELPRSAEQLAWRVGDMPGGATLMPSGEIKLKAIYDAIWVLSQENLSSGFAIR